MPLSGSYFYPGMHKPNSSYPSTDLRNVPTPANSAEIGKFFVSASIPRFIDPDGVVTTLNDSGSEGGGLLVTGAGADSLEGGLAATASNTNTTAVGEWSSATGANSIAYGRSAMAAGSDSVAVGKSTSAGGSGATTIGSNSNAAGSLSVALGISAQAGSAGENTSVGASSNAGGAESSCFGRASVSSGENSTAIGAFTDATTTGATALGHLAQATHAQGVAIGVGAATTAANRTTLGLVGGTSTQIQELQVSGDVLLSSVSGSSHLTADNSHLILSSSAGSIIALSGVLHVGTSDKDYPSTNRPIVLGSDDQIGDDTYAATYVAFGASLNLRGNTSIVFASGQSNNAFLNTGVLVNYNNHISLSSSLGSIVCISGGLKTVGATSVADLPPASDTLSGTIMWVTDVKQYAIYGPEGWSRILTGSVVS